MWAVRCDVSITYRGMEYADDFLVMFWLCIRSKWPSVLQRLAANLTGSRGFARLREERAKAEGLKEALDSLDRGDAHDSTALGALLRQCAALKSLAEGKRVHEHVVKAGYAQDTFLGNLVVQMYGKCGHLADARKAFDSIRQRNSFSYNIMITAYSHNGHLQEAKLMFDEIPERDVVTWNVMITAFAQNGHHEEALRYFQLMDLGGVRPNKYSFVGVLDACANLEALTEGKLAHELAAEQGLDEDLAVASGLVRMYSKCRRLEEARRVFDAMPELDVVLWTKMVAAYAQIGQLVEARILFERMPDKDAVAWTSMIAAYAQRGHWEEARRLFNRMPDPDLIAWNSMIAAYAQNGNCRGALRLYLLMDLNGMQPNSITFLSVFDACTSLGALAQGKVIHEGILGTEIESSVAVCNALVNMYGRCRDLDAAKAVFDKMHEQDVISWTCMISAYAQSGQLEQARSLLDQIPEWNVMAWDTMVVAYAQNGYLQEAQSMFDKMQTDVAAWTALITAYAENGCGKEALQLFRTGDLEGLQADLISFVGIIDACACCTSLVEGKILHAEAADRGFQLDVAVGTALVNMYGKCGQLERARSMFDELPDKNFITWNAMITAYSQNGHGKKALQLFPFMNLEGVHPTDVTFLGILSACSHAGLLENGHKYFAAIQQDYCLVPTLDHYVCMIDLLGRAGWLDAAEELVKGMPFEPHSIAWTALLGACKLHGDSKRGACAADQVFKLDSDTSAPYALLSSAYVAGENPGIAACS